MESQGWKLGMVVAATSANLERCWGKATDTLVMNPSTTCPSKTPAGVFDFDQLAESVPKRLVKMRCPWQRQVININFQYHAVPVNVEDEVAWKPLYWCSPDLGDAWLQVLLPEAPCTGVHIKGLTKLDCDLPVEPVFPRAQPELPGQYDLRRLIFWEVTLWQFNSCIQLQWFDVNATRFNLRERLRMRYHVSNCIAHCQFEVKRSSPCEIKTWQFPPRHLRWRRRQIRSSHPVKIARHRE